jgi:hypothetical protein
MKSKRASVLVASVTAAMMVVASAGAALADNPHAGKSDNFKGSATPCKQAKPCPLETTRVGRCVLATA